LRGGRLRGNGEERRQDCRSEKMKPESSAKIHGLLPRVPELRAVGAAIQSPERFLGDF
jgi:hypothetical protein